MTAVLWALTAVVAGVYLIAGLGKLVQPYDRLARRMPWVRDYPARVVSMIGALEVAGALGLVLPVATGIAPVLAPVAAFGLVSLQAGAVTLHLRRGERSMLRVNLVLLVLALVLGILRAAAL